MPRSDYHQAAQIQITKTLFADTAEAAGLPLESVYRALVVATDAWPEGSPPAPSPRGYPTTQMPLGMNEHTLVRFNEQVEVQAWTGDEGFLSPEEVIAQGKLQAVRGVMLDEQRGLPYLFFDERLNWLEQDLEPEQKARSELERSSQFWMAAKYLVCRACLKRPARTCSQRRSWG